MSFPSMVFKLWSSGRFAVLSERYDRIGQKNSTRKTDYMNFTCAACFSFLPDREELLKHVCFDGKTIYSKEGLVYCLSDDDNYSNEAIIEFDHNSILDDHDDIEREPYIPQLKHTTPKKTKKDVAMWTGSSTLALLTCYEAKKEDLDHPVKRGKVWASIAHDLSELGYKFSGEQVRWKFNTLVRKYKDCVDNNKRTGTGAMTLKYFDHMENILGDRKTVQGQSTISSTFAKRNPKSKSSTISTFTAQSDTSIPSPSTSSTVSTNSAKKRIYEDSSKSENGSSKNKQGLEKVALSNTETTVYPISVSNTQKSKRPQHGSGSRTATNKIELEKEWLQYLKNVADRDEMKKNKQGAYEKRKAEEVHMKKKLIALKERQLDIKQRTAKRKQEEATEWHRDKLNIEKQKCRVLRELLEARALSRSKKPKTDTDSSYED